MTPHGPDAETFRKASEAELKPVRMPDTMAFMFESSHVWRLTDAAESAPALQRNYVECWTGIPNNFDDSQ
jgi:homogentisate 1,2-dioxygenase